MGLGNLENIQWSFDVTGRGRRFSHLGIHARTIPVVDGPSKNNWISFVNRSFSKGGILDKVGPLAQGASTQSGVINSIACTGRP